MRPKTSNQHPRASASHHRRLLVTGPLLLSMLASPMMLGGCSTPARQWQKTVGNDTCEIDSITRQIDNPEPHVVNRVSMTGEPVTALTVHASEVSYHDLTLDEALRLAMEHSTVLRDIGGTILRAPATVRTGYADRLQQMDPRFGMESALSAFDAQLAASATFNKNDRIFNNNFFAGGTNAFQQDLHEYQMELSKRTATGSLLAVRGVSNFDGNNAPANTFTSAWNTWLEGEIRQPLLQGAGLEFNRVAGPGSLPGVYNGVLIAKANADINHSEFVKSLQDFVSNVENAYWDLYLSYRELDARKKAMEGALVEWNNAKNRSASGNIELGEEALARQQYYQLKSEVDEALSGRLLQGTLVQNGSSGGTLQLQGGVLTAERRLRLLIGMPPADGQLLRTTDEPTMASIHFDWYACMDEAIRQRPELQRTHISVRKREMELLAAKNFLNPRLDAVGRYRWRGFGDDLIADGNQGGNAPASSLGNLATGNQQEWTLGVELTVPIGYRRAHAAVQHAELSLARERAIQKEQQREVVSNLSGAVADAVRAYQSVENNLNQYLAAKEYLESLEARRDQNIREGVDRIVDAQRRLLQAELQFFRARAEYAVALKNVHYEKGSLLHYKDLRVAGEVAMHDYAPAEAIPVDEISPEVAPVIEAAPATSQPTTAPELPVSDSQSEIADPATTELPVPAPTANGAAVMPDVSTQFDAAAVPSLDTTQTDETQADSLQSAPREADADDFEAFRAARRQPADIPQLTERSSSTAIDEGVINVPAANGVSSAATAAMPQTPAAPQSSIPKMSAESVATELEVTEFPVPRLQPQSVVPNLDFDFGPTIAPRPNFPMARPAQAAPAVTDNSLDLPAPPPAVIGPSKNVPVNPSVRSAAAMLRDSISPIESLRQAGNGFSGDVPRPPQSAPIEAAPVTPESTDQTAIGNNQFAPIAFSRTLSKDVLTQNAAPATRAPGPVRAPRPDGPITRLNPQDGDFTPLPTSPDEVGLFTPLK